MKIFTVKKPIVLGFQGQQAQYDIPIEPGDKIALDGEEILALGETGPHRSITHPSAIDVWLKNGSITFRDKRRVGPAIHQDDTDMEDFRDGCPNC